MGLCIGYCKPNSECSVLYHSHFVYKSIELLFYIIKIIHAYKKYKESRTGGRNLKSPPNYFLSLAPVPLPTSAMMPDDVMKSFQRGQQPTVLPSYGVCEPEWHSYTKGAVLACIPWC